MAILRLDRLGPGAAALLRALGAPPGAALVGGVIRDVVLRRTEADPSWDIDVAVPSGALELARRCAERLRGTCVVLDAERGAARVIADGAALGVEHHAGAAQALGTCVVLDAERGAAPR